MCILIFGVIFSIFIGLFSFMYFDYQKNVVKVNAEAKAEFEERKANSRPGTV